MDWTLRVLPAATINFTGFHVGENIWDSRGSCRYTPGDRRTNEQTDRKVDSIIA